MSGLTDDERDACRKGASSLRQNLIEMQRIMGDDYPHMAAYKAIAKAEGLLDRLAFKDEPGMRVTDNRQAKRGSCVEQYYDPGDSGYKLV